MATILGEASLSTSFTTFSEDNSLAHSDSNRTVTTDFRRPLVIRAGLNNLADIFDESRTGEYIGTANILQYHNQDGNDYLITDPITNPAGSDHGTTDTNIFFTRFNQSNEVAEAMIQLQFDFTEIDHNAVFNEPNSFDIQIDIQSHFKGHDSYSGNQNSGTPNFGKIEAYWNPMNDTPTDSSFAVGSPAATVTLTDQTRQTITLSIPGHDANLGQPSSIHPRHTNTIAKFGKKPTIFLRFAGTVNSPLQPLSSIPAGSNFGYSGPFNTGRGLNVRIFGIKARYTYTGRTHLTTGLIEPQGGDYNFTNLIPFDAVYKGMGTLITVQTSNEPRTLATGNKILTLKNNSGDNILHSNPTGPIAKTNQPSLGDLEIAHTTNGSNFPMVMFNSNEYTNIVDDNIANEVVLDMNDIRDPSLDLVFYNSPRIGGTLVTSEIPMSTKRLNIAYAPQFTGTSDIAFAFSVADIDADQIHGIIDSELSDIAPSFTVTTLGGLRISDPQPEVDFSFTTEVDPSTAGLIKSYSSGVTQDISTSFTVTATASVTKSTTVSPSFSISVADTAGTVLVNTLTSSPIQVSVNFNIANPDADEVGVLHQVTSLVPAEPSAVVAIASLSDLVVIRAPSLERKLVRPNKTHTFKADPQQRTVKLEPFTRIIQAEMLKTLVNLRWSDTGTWSVDTTWGSKTGKARNIKAEQETRTVSSSQLDR